MATTVLPGNINTCRINVTGYTLVAGVLVKPEVPGWYSQPYIVTLSVDQLDQLYATPSEESPMKSWRSQERESWMRAWPSGTRFETHCRIIPAFEATCLGIFPSLAEALHCAYPLAARRAML